jgi:hypothetical protein
VLRSTDCSTNPGLAAALGRTRAQYLARWLRENVAGLAGNVSLSPRASDGSASRNAAQPVRLGEGYFTE